MVQSLKTLFLYTQSEKVTVEEYGRNFRSLWETVEAFRGLPGIHKGMMESLLSKVTRNPMVAQIEDAQETASKAVKVALLISRVDKRCFAKLKDELVNNYLLGMDQYPDTFNKALRILGNYQNTRASVLYKTSPNDTGVAFLQQSGQGGQGMGRAGQGAGRGEKNNDTATSNNVSMMTGCTGMEGPRKNSRGESHCFHCGGATHWAYECPQLTGEQQAQLHMNLETGQDKEEVSPTKEGHSCYM